MLSSFAKQTLWSGFSRVQVSSSFYICNIMDLPRSSLNCPHLAYRGGVLARTITRWNTLRARHFRECYSKGTLDLLIYLTHYSLQSSDCFRRTLKSRTTLLLRPCLIVSWFIFYFGFFLFLCIIFFPVKNWKLVSEPSSTAIKKKENISKINIYKKALAAYVFFIYPLRK